MHDTFFDVLVTTLWVVPKSLSTFQLEYIPVRRVESITVEGLRRRGRPKRTWDEQIKQDMRDLHLSEDMTCDRIYWRRRIRIVDFRQNYSFSMMQESSFTSQHNYLLLHLACFCLHFKNLFIYQYYFYYYYYFFIFYLFIYFFFFKNVFEPGVSAETASLPFLGRGKACLHLTLPRPYFRVGFTGSVWFGLVYGFRGARGFFGCQERYPKFIHISLLMFTSSLPHCT